MSNLLGDGPHQEREGAAVEAGLDPFLQVAHQFLLVSRDLFLMAILARARLGLLLFVAPGPRLLSGDGGLLGHCSSSLLGTYLLPGDRSQQTPRVPLRVRVRTGLRVRASPALNR